MELFNFNAAYPQIRELYGIELHPDEFETLGLNAWDKIGNKMYTLKTVTLPVEQIKGQKSSIVRLPCDVDAIESVCIAQPDFQKTNNLQETPLIYNQYVEQYIDLRRGSNTNTAYSNGAFVKYRVLDQNTLELMLQNGTVDVTYKTIKYDCDDLPLINKKEIDAIACYCAYSTFFKQSLMTRDQSTFQMAQVLEQKWQKLCDHARTPMHMSQNDFDAIGDIKSSWDRKTYGKSFKPMR